MKSEVCKHGFCTKIEGLTSNIMCHLFICHSDWDMVLTSTQSKCGSVPTVPISSTGPAEKLIAQTKFSPALPHPSYRKKISFLRSQLARKREMSRNEMRRYSSTMGAIFFFYFLTARMGLKLFLTQSLFSWPNT